MDLFVSYVLCVSESKIKDTHSSITSIFPDRNSFNECLKKYEQWKDISVKLAIEKGN